MKATEASKRKPEEEDDEDSEDERPPINLVEKYTKMIELMKPGESVQKAIRRLGGNKASWSASNRWKKKKEASESTAKNAENEADPEKLLLLTSLADEIVHSGDMDVYQQTYEKMSFYVNSKAAVEKSGLNGDDPSLDMFGDDFEEKVDENKPSERVPSPTAGKLEFKEFSHWSYSGHIFNSLSFLMLKHNNQYFYLFLSIVTISSIRLICC